MLGVCKSPSAIQEVENLNAVSEDLHLSVRCKNHANMSVAQGRPRVRFIPAGGGTEISVAPGRRRDDHPEQCEYLYNSAIQHSASHGWQVMQRRLTGYIAFGETFRVRPILQLSAPGSKNHRRCTSIAGRKPHCARRDFE